MENLLEKYFDRYTILARIMPGFAALTPAIIYVYLQYNFFNINGVGIASIFIIAVITLIARISRDLGKKREDKLFKEMGAPPTTILLRYSDSEIDCLTKDRYHLFLNNNIPNLNLPLNLNDELEDIVGNDEKYTSAIRWLRNKTRNKKDYPLVFKDNVNYGFVRNLYGLKSSSLLLYTGLFILELIRCLNIKSKEAFILLLSKGFINVLSQISIGLILIFFTIFIFIFYINKKMFISSAKAYARSLLEVCESI